MLPNWLNAREATEVGTALADDFVMQTAGPAEARHKAARPAVQSKDLQKFLQRFVQRVDRDALPLRLNLFKRAKLANSFKWRLLEKGVDREIVDELTRVLTLRLTVRVPNAHRADEPLTGKKARPSRDVQQALLNEGSEHFNRGEYQRAVECLRELLKADPRNLTALNILGNALCRLGRYDEGAAQFRQAINIKETHPESHHHLGGLLRTQGLLLESEQQLRRALKLQPTLIQAQISLGATLFMLGKLVEARELLEKALRVSPRNVEALMHIGKLAGLEGNKEEAESWYQRALEVDPKAWLAWVGIGELRKFTAADAQWLKGAQAAASNGLAPLSEASVHCAIGRYYDQIGEYENAFNSFRRAKELVKTAGATYSRPDAERNSDTWIRTYTRETLARERLGASESDLPVIVTGMPRSGTSLVEQIIASHPAASGVGELNFWANAIRKRESGLALAPPDESTSRKLAAAYLDALTANSGTASRVVDKSIFNFLFLGPIHAIFPRARMICMQRDPVDTCLSCYFQDFAPSLSFAHDLSDLAHLYRQHHKMMAHWRNALPPGTLIEIPYEELTADQEGWTRRMLEFLGLPWDDRCLQFHTTKRAVVTASHWQVRQKIYKSSIARWRKYEKFIGPLLELRDLRS
jgi:tetratricopeptide (TPR) repeat protein